LLTKFKTTNSNVNLGISFDSDTISICVTEPSPDGRVVTQCTSIKGNQSRAELLKQLIKDKAIPNGAVTLALAVEDHKIHKIARPLVEDSEIKQAAIWLIKDRLDCGVEQAMVDVINYPEGCQLDDQIMVVQTSKDTIQGLVDTITEVGLDLKSIDITELLLGDILQSYPGIEQGIALVLDHEEGATLLVYRGEYLYLIRKLSGVRDLTSCLPVEGNMMMAEHLLLEIQRTLDYYDAQMRQPPLAGILLAPSLADISKLTEYLNNNLDSKVEYLDINNFLNLPEPLSPAKQQDCLPACAAAFRREPKK